MTTETRKKVVRDTMDRFGWTQARLGRTLGVTKQRIRQLLEADGPGDGRHAEKIAAALGVKPSELVDPEGLWRVL